MARLQIQHVAQTADPITFAVKAASGATVQVNNRNTDGTTGSAATTVYAAATGGSPIGGGTLTADSAGRVVGWCEPGRYVLTISGAGITTYSQPWDANPKDDYENAFGTYKKHGPHMFVRADALTGASTYVLTDNSTAPIGVSNAAAALGVFYLDPADWTAGSRTTYLRMRASCLTNAVAPAVNLTVGLYPVTAVAGAAATTSISIGSVIAGSTVAFNTPAATSLNQGNSGDFASPVAGYYTYALLVSGNSAASSSQAITCVLQMREV